MCGQAGAEGSLRLPPRLFNAVCLLDSFLSRRRGGLVVMKMLISLSPGGPDCSVVPLTRSCAHALAAY